MNSLSSGSYRRQTVGFLKKLKFVTLGHESVHAYNTECVDYCGRVWTVTKAVEFCSKLQGLDKDMLYTLYAEAKKHRSE